MTLDAETARNSLRPGDVVQDVGGSAYRVVDVDGDTSVFVAWGPLEDDRPRRSLESLGWASLTEYAPRERADDVAAVVQAADSQLEEVDDGAE
jgi:hypothetical protein